MFKNKLTETSVNLDCGNYWSSLKKLNQIMAKVVLTQSSDSLYDLGILLKRHKLDLLSLLKNEPRNASHREYVQKASKEGIFIIQAENKSNTIIPETIVDEALLFSDMFNLNEIIALELIVTGVEQEARYPGMTRGPIAVLLYYDAKRSLLNSLKLIVDSTNGRSWSTKLNSEVYKFMDDFLAQLKDQNIIYQCLEQLETFDVTDDFDLLLINRALGPGKYKKQIFDIIKEIKQLYAEIVFSFSAQFDLNSKETAKLIQILSKKCELDSNGCLDYVSTTLLMSLLHLIDVSLLQNCEENDPLIKSLPIYKHKSLFENIQTAISNEKFTIPIVQNIISFVWIISVKTLSLFPIEGVTLLEGEEDKMLDEVIDKKVFESMTLLLAQNPHVYKEEFYFRKLHEILSDFIAFFPLKIKELRDKDDESGRIIAAYMAENIQPPSSLSRHFEKFLYLIAEVYLHDTYSLSAEIWNASKEENRVLSKALSFHKFIRSTIDSFLPQLLHVPVLKLLASFANLSPFNVYNLLKCSEINQNSQFSFEQFFNVLHNYYSSLRGASKVNSAPINFDQTHRSQITNFATIYLSPLELDILCSIFQLIENIVKNDRNCCLSIAENQRYSCISTMVGLLISPVPRKLKAAILSAFSGFAETTSSVALGIWIKIDMILPKPQIAVKGFVSINQQITWSSGIAVEIEDIEPRNEEYPITISFLKAINSIAQHICCNRQPQHQSSFESCVTFVINSILLKSSHRVYKLEEEKWTIKYLCIRLITLTLEIFDPLKDGPLLKGAFSVMSQLLQKNSLFTCLMEIIEDIVAIYEAGSMNLLTSSQKNTYSLEECLLIVIKLFNLVSLKEVDFIQSIHNLPGYPSAMVMTLSALFSNVNHRTENIDRLATLIKIFSLPSTQVQIESLKLLQNLIQSDPRTSERMLLQIKPFIKYHEDYFIHGFVDCVEAIEDDLSIEALRFLLKCAQRDNVSGVYGFSHRLLGFDRNKGNLRMSGTLGQTFTCFHAILGILSNDDENYKKRSLSMEIIYTLCKDLESSETILRFLRTSYEFIAKYLKKLERKLFSFKEKWINKQNILEIAWFLKILSIELKTTTDNNLKTNRNSYIKSLLGEKGDKKLTDFVPQLIFTYHHPEMAKWEFFDSNELLKTFSETTSTSDNVIDIKLLHQKLLSEINLVGNQLGLMQTNAIQHEIQKILEYATILNVSQEELNSNIVFFEGWRDLIETLISLKCLEIYDVSIRVRVLLELVQELIQKASSISNVTLITPQSSVILLSCACLSSFKPDLFIKTHLLTTAKGIMNLLESSSFSFLWSQYKRARVNLYGALLHVYRILPQPLRFELKLSSRLLEKLCKDTLSGHEITKVLAMSVLNESETTWARDLSNDGTLRLIIDSLIMDDKEIKAHKFDVHCKAFYSFDSKMALLMKICNDAVGVKIINHIGIVDVLSSLECFELYPFLIGQSDVCYKMFVSILRLMLTLSNFTDRQYTESFMQFMNLRYSVLSDILRMASTIKNTPEGINVLTLITALISKVISSINQQLQRSFKILLNNFLGSVELNESRIVANLLLGYVRISLTNDLTPIFAPSWDYQSQFTSIGLPTLGSLIYLIDENANKCSQSKTYLCIVESCLYLLWHHLNLYFTLGEVGSDQKVDVAKVRSESAGIVSDLFFAKIQNATSGNFFIDSMVRRIKRVIRLN